MAILIFALAILASYLLGSVPAGYLVGRMHGIDLRKVGSGNVGATNVVRNLGKPLGIAVFVFDFLKGFLPAFLGGLLLVDGGHLPWSRDVVALAMGLAAVLGHVFPVWLGFRGGKGVATSAGFCAGICWQAVGLALLVWYVALLISRYVSVASMVSAVSFPVIFIVFVGPDAAFGERRLVTVLAILLAIVIICLHRSNIRRLLRGEEERIGKRRPGEESE